MSIFKCKGCEAYKKQVEHQQGIIDSLLMKLNVKPVVYQPYEKIEKPDPLIDKEKYGE